MCTNTHKNKYVSKMETLVYILHTKLMMDKINNCCHCEIAVTWIIIPWGVRTSCASLLLTKINVLESLLEKWLIIIWWLPVFSYHLPGLMFSRSRRRTLHTESAVVVSFTMETSNDVLLSKVLLLWEWWYWLWAEIARQEGFSIHATRKHYQ